MSKPTKDGYYWLIDVDGDLGLVRYIKTVNLIIFLEYFLDIESTSYDEKTFDGCKFIRIDPPEGYERSSSQEFVLGAAIKVLDRALGKGQGHDA